MKKLKKSNNKIICGVCGGVASYFNIDPTIVRILVVILSCIWVLVLLFTSPQPS